MYCGSWKLDDLLTFDCATHTASTGAATDADGAPAYRVYEDETSTPILTGTMALLDSSNTAGFYTEQITLSAANGFEKGKRYTVYISAAVGGVTGVTTRNFQMEAEVDANVVSGGVNVTQFGGSAGTFASGRPEVNTSHFGGSAGTFASGIPAVNTTQISGDSTAADNVETAYDDTAGAVPWHGIIDQGTAQAATGTTIQLRSAASFGDDTIIGATVAAFGSTQGYWQVQVITDYVSSTDTATVPGWTVTPSGTITYKIFGSAAGTTPADSAGVTTLLSRLTSTRAGYLDNLSAGAVATAAKLLSYFQSLLRKDVTVDADIGGNYDDATDSLEAIRDRGDAAWTTATGFSTHSASDVWASDTRTLTALDEDSTTIDLDAAIESAVATALASYDGPTNAEMEARTLAAASYATAAALSTVDTVVDSILSLLDDAQSEPAQGAPAANADVVTKIAYIYQWARNRKTNNGTENAYYADNGTTINQKQTTSEAAGTVEVGEMTTGA